MANVANVIDAQFGTYRASEAPMGQWERAPNVRAVTCTLFEGGTVLNGMGWVSTRFPLPSPDPQHGSTTPLGPQRWPL